MNFLDQILPEQRDQIKGAISAAYSFASGCCEAKYFVEDFVEYIQLRSDKNDMSGLDRVLSELVPSTIFNAKTASPGVKLGFSIGVLCYFSCWDDFAGLEDEEWKFYHCGAAVKFPLCNQVKRNRQRYPKKA